MRAKTQIVIILALLAIAFASCTTIIPVSATSNEVNCTRKGESSYTTIGFSLLGLGGQATITGKGDASIETACAKAGIKKISTVSQKQTHILFIHNYKTIVCGE